MSVLKSIIKIFFNFIENCINFLKNIVLRPYSFFKYLFFITGITVWIGVIFLGIYVYSLFNKPDFDKINFAKIKIIAKKSVEKKVKKSGYKHSWVNIDKIDRQFLYAIVMGEDGTFFSHSGVNYDAFINALGENIKRRKYAFGASTISQQVTKNLFLNNSKAISRKIKEIFITRRLEQKFTKNQILEIYLNIAEFGPKIYGVREACRYYFKKNPRKANCSNGAFLALLLPSPKKYHLSIYKNKYLSKRHRNKIKRILKDMLYKEYISPKQYKKYIRHKYF